MTRFTWEYPTYGIQSSQRSEAINSAIKLWVKPNMRVVELVETIERYNLDSRDRKLVHAHLQARRNCITSASSCALVLSMQKHLTPFAYNLVLEQEKLMNKYKTEECHGSDGDVYFRVSQTVHTDFQIDEHMNFAKDGRPHNFGPGVETGEFDICTDYRFSTQNTCSCLFPSAYGLPCRHILASLHHRQHVAYPHDLLASKWRPRTKEEIASLTAALRMVPKPSAACGASTRPAAASVIPSSRNDKYKALHAVGREVADEGSNSEWGYKVALSALETVLAELRIGEIIVSAEEAEALHPVEPEPSAQPAKKSSRSKMSSHEKDFYTTMGVHSKVDAKPSEADASDGDMIIGKRIIYKYPLTDNPEGAWFLGTIRSMMAPRNWPLGGINVKVKFDSDRQTQTIELVHAAYTVDGKAKHPGSWGFISAVPLNTVDDTSTVHNPIGGNRTGPGRPNTVRSAPAAGPMSKKGNVLNFREL